MENIKIEGVSTIKVSQKYTFQFWMSYNYVNSTFGGVTFFWNGHNKLIVQKGSQSSLFLISMNLFVYHMPLKIEVLQFIKN